MSNTQEWIKFDDKKPESGSWVWVACKYMMTDYVTIAEYKNGRFTSSMTNMDTLVRSEIKAWMPFRAIPPTYTE